MQLNIAPGDILQFDDATIIFKNFTGEESMYNRAGDRNFSVLIDDEDVANAIQDLGYNIKIKEPREEGDIPFMHMPVKIKFNARGPKCYLISGNMEEPIELDEESIEVLDNIDIARVDVDIRPYDWVMNEGKPSEKRGRSAYLYSIHVVQEVNRFAARYGK